MLVPVQKVGSIIGRKGEFIRKITEDTKARIKILDGPPGTSERAVSILFQFLVIHAVMEFVDHVSYFFALSFMLCRIVCSNHGQ